MNPHFIFNALNSVNSFIATNDERAANRYLSEFSGLMRAVLENSEEDFIPLSKEIELLQKYTKLEHFRFQDKFDYDILVDDAIPTNQFKIPPMLLQPYIENAVWHGLRYKKEKGFLTITHPKMTRFHISLDQAIETVLYSISNNLGGEIFIPKGPSYRILDLAKAIAPNCKTKVTGIRLGEKIDEELISKNESGRVVDLGKYYAVLSSTNLKAEKFYFKKFKKVKKNFIYSSGSNNKFLSIKELKKIIHREF